MRRWWLAAVLAGLGAMVVVLLTLAAGSVCVDGVSESFCGKNFLVWGMSSWGALALAAAFGGLVGIVLGLVVTWTRSIRGSSG